MDGPQGTLPGANLPYTRGNTCNHSPTQLGEVTANTAGQGTNTNDQISHHSGATTHKTGGVYADSRHQCPCRAQHSESGDTVTYTHNNNKGKKNEKQNNRK